MPSNSIQSVIILVINKSDSRLAVDYVYYSYDYRLNWTPLSPIAIINYRVVFFLFYYS